MAHRSSWKGPYISNILLRKIPYRQVILTNDRASTILPIFRGRKIYVYDGRYHRPIIITRRMVGQKLGS